MTKTEAARYYYRCEDCLSIGASEQALAGNAICDSCEGPIEYLGRVHRNRLISTEQRCPCDERCTNATGPNCECSCGGENHGTGRLVEVIISERGIPRVKTNDRIVSLLLATDWRAAKQSVRAALNARYRDVIDLRRAGAYLRPDDYARYKQVEHFRGAFGHIVKGRSHARTKKAIELAERIQSGAAY